MDRVLEAPVKKSKVRLPSRKEERRVLFPGEREWGCWSIRGGLEARLQSSLPPEEWSAKLKGPHDLALPMQHILLFPLWLATTDASLMRAMAALQLESRGLSRAATEATFDYIIVKQESDRSLLAVSVLSDLFPQNLCLPRTANYRPVPDYWDLPMNHLLLWKELGRTMIAFTAGSNLVWVQSSPGESLHNSLLSEAHCARLQLENDGTIAQLLGITVMGTFPREDLENLRLTFGLPLQQLDRPAPRKPRTVRNVLPAPVQEIRNRKKTAQNRSRLFMATAVIYLLLVLGVAGQLGFRVWQRTVLETDLSWYRGDAASIRETSERWQALELALLPETYPVEVLYRCTRLLPEEGVRFLTYDQDRGRVLITGESKNALAALQYFEALKNDPDLAAYFWDMPPPKLLPNDSAQFQIEGKRRDAKPEGQ